MLKPLQVHAYYLAKAIISINGQSMEYVDVHDWLLLASGIDEITFDVTKYDTCLQYCGRAAEYEYRKEELTEEFVKNLAVFQFIWGAFEALLNELSLPEVSGLNRGRTKVDSPCYFLKCNEKEQFKGLGYEHVFVEFRAAAQKFFEPSQFQSCFSPKRHVSDYSQGLYIIYKIRNHYAHGRTKFPEAYSDDDDTNYESILMALSCRIVLLTMQMMILAYYADTASIVDCCWTDDFGEVRDEVSLATVFSELQMA